MVQVFGDTGLNEHDLNDLGLSDQALSVGMPARLHQI